MTRLGYLFLAISIPLYAENPFECVDSDFAGAFLADWYVDQAEYSTIIPKEFVSLDVPAGFSLVGSEKRGMRTTVAFTTDLERDIALDTAIEALIRAGWSENTAGTSRGGFRTAKSVPTRHLCRDEETGGVWVRAVNRSGKTFLAYIEDSAPHCRRPSDKSEIRMNALLSQLPVLAVPAGASTSHWGKGGTGDEVNIRVDIFAALERSAVLSHFEDQLQTQNWEYQARWATPVSSGSVWTVNSEEHGTYVGTLHLFDSGAEPIRARFSVSPAEPAENAGGGTWSGSAN